MIHKMVAIKGEIILDRNSNYIPFLAVQSGRYSYQAKIPQNAETQPSGLCIFGLGPCMAIYIETMTHVLVLHNDTLRPITMIQNCLHEHDVQLSVILSLQVGFNPSFHTLNQITELESALHAQYPSVNEINFIGMTPWDRIGMGIDGKMYDVMIDSCGSITPPNSLGTILSAFVPRFGPSEQPISEFNAPYNKRGWDFSVLPLKPIETFKSPSEIYEDHCSPLWAVIPGNLWCLGFYVAYLLGMK